MTKTAAFSLEKQLTDPAERSPNGTPIVQSVMHNAIPIRAPIGSPNEAPNETPNETPDEAPDGSVILTENQAVLYFCLKEINGSPTSLSRIAGETAVSEHTLKSYIQKFRREGLIIYNGRKNLGGLMGFTATVCDRKFILRGNADRLSRKLHLIDAKRMLLAEVTEQSIEHFLPEQGRQHRMDHPMESPLKHPMGRGPISSSSFTCTKTATVPGRAPDTGADAEKTLEEELRNNPELGYWRQKGLTAKQAAGWMRETGCGPNTMVRSLCRCRYEMVDLGMEESKPVENVFNWFYRIVERTGHYPAPKGYGSFPEIQLERERQLLEENRRKIRELEELYREQWEQRREREFREMMNSPQGELHKKCYSRLNNFEKKLKKGTVLEAIMEAAPKKVFKTVIKRSIAVADSHSSHLPLVMRNKTHPVAKSYRSFTKELLHYVEKK